MRDGARRALIELAREIIAGRPMSYVGAARVLADAVLLLLGADAGDVLGARSCPLCGAAREDDCA